MRWLTFAAVVLLACAQQPPESPHWNVLLLSADSLRSDRLALWNPEDGVATPNLEALAARGSLYTEAWAVTPWTAPSMVSVFTGLHPPSHGVVYRDDTTPPGLPTLATRLSETGYRLGNFTFFSEISYFRNLGLPPPAPGLRHGRETEAFLRWLDEDDQEDEAERPFFAWIHLLEPHLPYGASGYRATEIQIPGSSGLERAQLQATVPVGSVEFEADDRASLVELYDQDVERLDRAVGAVIDGLRERGLEDRTIVVFVADHGEELLDDGWVGHASTAIKAKLAAPLLHIPLILVGPGVEPASLHAELVQHVDVLPTVLALLGLKAPEHSDGILLPGTTDDASFGRPRGLGRLFSGLFSAEEGAPRAHVHFDTSMGGNLTPRDRIGERLQGVSDGECLLVSHVTPGEGPTSAPSLVHLVPGPIHCEERRETLSGALAAWRRDQVEQRLEIVRAQPASGAPGPEADSFEEALAVRAPTDGRRLTWSSNGGQITLEWDGDGSSHWVEYRVGRRPALVEGSFEVEQDRVLFGPFPRAFWNDLAGYSPFRFRVLDPERRQRSAWITFEVAPVGSAGGPGAR